MVFNSKSNNGEQNSSKTQLIINTSALSGEGYSFQLNDNQQRSFERKMAQAPTTVKSKVLFDCATLNEDGFLNTLEHQCSYIPAPIVPELDLKQSIDDLIKFFHETDAPDAESCDMLCKQTEFRTKTVHLTPSPLHFRKRTQPIEAQRPNIQELRRRYETGEHELSRSPKKVPKSPRFSRKSMVEQITKMFNSKITQLMRQNSDAKKYKPLQNELSPEPKPAPKMVFNSKSNNVQQNSSKPQFIINSSALSGKDYSFQLNDNHQRSFERKMAQAPTTVKSKVPAPKSVSRSHSKTRSTKMPTYRPQLLPSPVPSPRLRRKQQMRTNCLVAEDVFRQLSVKDKAMLYNKFIDDMSKQSSEFAKHAELMQAKKQFGRGGVVNEKQETVRHLTEELEAKCKFPKCTVSQLAIQQVKPTTKGPKKSSFKRPAPNPPTKEQPKSKEMGEAYLEGTQFALEDSTHVSTLTVVLKPSPDKALQLPKTSPLRKREVRFLDEIGIIAPTQKRNNTQIRSTLKIDVYAPPKKIRRTQADRLAPKLLFQNLFYDWLKEKSGIDFEITSVQNVKKALSQKHGKDVQLNSHNEREKSAVAILLKEVSAKLDTSNGMENPAQALTTGTTDHDTSLHKSVLEIAVPLEVKVPLASIVAKPQDKASTPVPTPRKLKKGPATPIPSPRKINNETALKSLKVLATPIPSSTNSEAGESTASSARQSDADERESGLSTISKITSEDSQAELVNKQQEFEFAKPLKPPRKKKIRRNIVAKKDTSSVPEPQLTTTTTDSDSDYKPLELPKKIVPPPLPKAKKQQPHAKKLNFHNNTVPQTVQAQKQEPSFAELDTSLMRAMNSPRKIKSRYTLTVMSSPSPRTGSDVCESDMPRTPCRETSRSWPSMVDQDLPMGTKAVSTDLVHPSTSIQNQSNDSQRLMVSYDDQGFETGSNEMDSPVRLPARTEASNNNRGATPLFFKLPNESELLQLRRLSSSSSRRSSGKPSGFSTPTKGQLPQATNETVQQQFNFSPITALPSMKSRRRSIYEGDPRRSSVIMQAIHEDHPLEQHETSQSPNSISSAQNAFFPNNMTTDVATSTERSERTSVFWITAGDFCVSIDIFYNTPDRLRLLYDIFGQKSFETHELHFGIDDQKFSVNSSYDKEDISKRLPRNKGCSHYWFSTGDLAVPFSGKYMAKDKVKRLFNFVSEAVLESSVLRFGVDRYEFSNVPEFSYSNPKLSMESNYSMLVGLQGANNGLEGRSKYAWPSTMTASMNSNGIKTSDLDHSEFESDCCDINEMRLSFSPFGSNHFDLSSLDSADLSMQRNSDAMMSPEMFSLEYENEPLDQLFEDTRYKNREKQQQECQKATEIMPKKVAEEKRLNVPQMLNIVQAQQRKLRSVEKRIHSYASSTSYIDKELEQFKGTPEYVAKLQEIVASINNIGQETGFKYCSLTQLESFTFFLSRYADICLASCSEHMDVIQDALLEKRAVQPPENELQKSHEQNPNALSEHQLRVQASLQRLNIPDWFRTYNQSTARSPDGANAGTYKPGNFTRKRTSESSGRWAGLNSKTTSLSSLGSQRSDRSPLLLSPSAHSHHGGQSSTGAHQHHQHHAGTAGTHGAGTGGGASSFSRWSTSHLNSSQTSPSCSQRGSFSRGGPVNSSFMSVASGQSGVSAVRNSFRQPYLGWRSQEKLSQRTPHERLASSLLAAQQQRTCSTPKASNGVVKQHPVTPEIQSSIKEVTSAIVHYVNDQTQQQRSRSTSPNSRKCWLESSFVGTRPLDSPQTPVIENTTTFSAQAAAAAAAAATGLQQYPGNFNSSNNYNNNSISSGYYNNSSATSSIYSATTTTNADVLRMNGLSCGVAPERSLSSASLEDVLASLLGLPSNTAGTGASARSTTGDSASESLATLRHMPQTATPTSLQVDPNSDQRLRRRSEGDAPKQQQQQQQQQQKQQSQQQQQQSQQQPNSHNAKPNQAGDTLLSAPMRRVSLGDSSDSNNKTTSELQIKCRNTKCDQTATPADAKKYYKSCHNCSHLYCSRECRRAHWEKHRKACLHSRASNLCRQVLATCKDDLDSQRHLSLLARKGFLSQGRGVVRVLFRSAEAAEGFIKHGFQCMGEASYVRWPDLMPAEMGLELYSELLKLSTEYKPDSKMLIYVAICVVSEAPGTAQAPVKWERQLVSRCAKLKLCKTILAELEQQQQALQLQQPIALVAVPEPATEILILTFNPSAHTTAPRREIILSNILSILSRRGVFLRKHYPEIYQRLQTYADGQTDKFQPVTLHPRDSQTGQSFVCIIMPMHSESGIIKMPSVADGGNRVNTIDVGAANALTNLPDDVMAQS